MQNVAAYYNSLHGNIPKSLNLLDLHDYFDLVQDFYTKSKAHM